MSDPVRCACGCGELVVPTRRRGRPQRYVNRDHWRAHSNTPAFAAWRQARAARASAAAVVARQREAAANATRFRSRHDAYAAGYKTGYNRAARWWRARYARLAARLTTLERAS